ncbi:hypothetical protein WJX73_005282 [Symbiochloris irregularis]|uniref:Bacteriorhodopsin n=1 Tax=Symbiochloris irregularis TaxID=706552 RepID=A0AAW1P3D3_9CHLO
MGFWGFRLPAEKRDHFIITTMIVATAALSYYAMATGYGQVNVDFPTNGLDLEKAKVVTRPIFYARYIDWSITTPLLLLDVLLMAKLPLSSTAWAIYADLAMVITGLIGGLVGDSWRWGWFALGCFFMIAIFVSLFVDGAKAVAKRDNSLSSFYNSTVLGLVILWTAYPIVWAFGEGTNQISSDVEVYLYAILDVLAKVGWGGFILYHNERLTASYSKGIGRSDAETGLLQD